MPLKDIYSKLKTTIVSTTTSKIDAKLDDAVKSITSYKTQSGRNGYIELIRSLVSKTADVQISTGGGLFSQGTTPAAFGQGTRLLRYKTYEAIVANINYCFRALNVLVDNILSPDDITKVALEIKPTDPLEEEKDVESDSKIVEEIVKVLKIEENLHLLVRSTLQFGDLFCEIADEKTALTSKSLLSETEYNELVSSDIPDSKKELLEYEQKDDKYRVTMDYSALSEIGDAKKKNDKSDESDESEEEELVKLSSLRLVFHDPKFVIKLQSSLFPMCFGYLVFPQMTLLPGSVLQDEPINAVCTQILQSLAKRIPQMKEFKDSKDLKDIVRSMLAQTDLNKAMDIRYVPPDRVIHFRVPSIKYYPYGESIFDSCQFSAKVLIALETALAIQRLSRSTEKRKISVEIGLPRDARKAVEDMKEEFRKRKISLDSFGTVDTIPSMISTFEDIYIPTKDGKAFVDVDTFTGGNVDIRSKVDELKFIRDSVVASLGVPPSFIGIEENLSNKAALGEENILFARTIVSHQKFLTHQIRELIGRIIELTNPEVALTIFDNVDIAFSTPRSLQYEREARYMSEFANLVETLDRIGIPKEWAKKRYLTQVDWNEIKKYEIGEKIEKDLDPDKKREDEEIGGVGGMGATSF